MLETRTVEPVVLQPGEGEGPKYLGGNTRL